MNQRDKGIAALGGLMILIPVILILGFLFVAVAVAFGTQGIVTGAVLVGLVVLVWRRAG